VTDERVRESLEHLQRAALEVIAAARLMLDAAEEVVREPGALTATLGAAAARATEAARPMGEADPRARSRVEPIDVDR
jgi:hypothetical protein